MKRLTRLMVALALALLLQGCGMLVIKGARHVYEALRACPEQPAQSPAPACQ